MYFLIHIREMEDKTELNGVESYVYEKVRLLYSQVTRINERWKIKQNLMVSKGKSMKRFVSYIPLSSLPYTPILHPIYPYPPP